MVGVVRDSTVSSGDVLVAPVPGEVCVVKVPVSADTAVHMPHATDRGTNLLNHRLVLLRLKILPRPTRKTLNLYSRS